MRVIIPMAMLLAGVVPAPAQTSCTEPTAPPPIDGAQASADQLRAAMAQVRDFIAQAQMYQGCLQQSADPDATVRIAASQRAQEMVSKSVNMAVDTYKRLHAN